MGKCSRCDGDDNLPFTCTYCGNVHCSDHRLPEKHECSGSESIQPRSPRTEPPDGPARSPLGAGPETTDEAGLASSVPPGTTPDSRVGSGSDPTASRTTLYSDSGPPVNRLTLGALSTIPTPDYLHEMAAWMRKQSYREFVVNMTAITVVTTFAVFGFGVWAGLLSADQMTSASTVLALFASASVAYAFAPAFDH